VLGELALAAEGTGVARARVEADVADQGAQARWGEARQQGGVVPAVERAEAGDGGQALGEVGAGRLGGEQFGTAGIESGDQLAHALQGGALLRVTDVEIGERLAQAGEGDHQLGAAALQPQQFLHRGAGRRVGTQLGVLVGEVAGDQAGIEAVGFGTTVHGLGVVVQGPRVDQVDRQAAATGQCDCQLVIAAGRFQGELAVAGSVASQVLMAVRSLVMVWVGEVASAVAISRVALATSMPMKSLDCMAGPPGLG